MKALYRLQELQSLIQSQVLCVYLTNSLKNSRARKYLTVKLATSRTALGFIFSIEYNNTAL